MKKIELSEDFFSGMDRKKDASTATGSTRREVQAVKTILGTEPRTRALSKPRPTPSPSRSGLGTLLSLPFAMAGHMMSLCASAIRTAFPPFDRH